MTLVARPIVKDVKETSLCESYYEKVNPAHSRQ